MYLKVYFTCVTVLLHTFLWLLIFNILQFHTIYYITTANDQPRIGQTSWSNLWLCPPCSPSSCFNFNWLWYKSLQDRYQPFCKFLEFVAGYQNLQLFWRYIRYSEVWGIMCDLLLICLYKINYMMALGKKPKIWISSHCIINNAFKAGIINSELSKIIT